MGVNKFIGQYIRDPNPPKKKPKNGHELPRISLCTFSHNGKAPAHGGAYGN